MSIQEAKTIVRALGLTLRKQTTGEFRVNFQNGGQESAYYTDDLADAVDTARVMADSTAFYNPEMRGEFV